MFGVRPPIMPRWYALMFQTPTSSVIIITMLGLFSCAETVGATASPMTATNAAKTKPSGFIHFVFMHILLFFPIGSAMTRAEFQRKGQIKLRERRDSVRCARGMLL